MRLCICVSAMPPLPSSASSPSCAVPAEAPSAWSEEDDTLLREMVQLHGKDFQVRGEAGRGGSNGHSPSNACLRLAQQSFQYLYSSVICKSRHCLVLRECCLLGALATSTPKHAWTFSTRPVSLLCCLVHTLQRIASYYNGRFTARQVRDRWHGVVAAGTARVTGRWSVAEDEQLRKASGGKDHSCIVTSHALLPCCGRRFAWGYAETPT